MKFYNLPLQPTPFIGRAEEIGEIKRLLADPACRLLTLAGPGGIGKTRLAIESAARMLGDYPDGVYFVPLQPVQSYDFLISAIADAVHFLIVGSEPPRVQLLNYLQDKKMLLLLDNFEQLLPSATAPAHQTNEDGVNLLKDILQTASDLQLLVTSREVLNLQIEWVYAVEGMIYPRSTQVEAIESYSAVQLFIEHAQRIWRGFSLADELEDVIHICQLVEGIPLAIELAASWIKTLSCAEIVAELRRSLNILATNLRDMPERHQNMQAVFGHSWKLLNEEEQEAFKKLSVFRGGFQRSAAEGVAGASLPILSALVNKSLLRRTPDGRYRVHELLRQFASDKLDDAEKAALTEAHCLYYCDFLAQRKLGLTEGTQVETSAEVKSELENIRAAWQYALEHDQTEALKKAAAPYFYFCQLQSRYLESAEASGRAVEVLKGADDLPGMAQVLVYQGWMLIRIGRFEHAARVLERSGVLFEELNLTPSYGMGSHPIAPFVITTVVQGDYARAVTLGEKLKSESAARGDKHNQSFACYGLTSAYLNQGQYQAALENGSAALQLVDEIGNHWFSGYCHIELGNVHRSVGHFSEAERHYRESLAIKEAYEDPEGIAVATNQLGEIALIQHDYQAAQQLYEQSLSIYQKLNDKGGLAAAHHGLGQAAIQAGDDGLAANHYQEALDIASKINYVPLMLSLLVDVGSLMINNDLEERGVELLQLVHNHPVTNQQQQEKAASLFEGAPFTEDAPLPDLTSTVIAVHSELLDFVPSAPAETESPLLDPLTDREVEVLHLLAGGLSNPAIAERLFIAVGTVKAHTNRIYSKLGVTNRVEAVTKAQALSLLSDNP